MWDQYLKPKDHKALGNNHEEGSFFLAGCESNGQPSEDGQTEIMSIRFTYAESEQDLAAKKLKQIKFWLDKDMGAFFADAMYRAAVAGKMVN